MSCMECDDAERRRSHLRLEPLLQRLLRQHVRVLHGRGASVAEDIAEDRDLRIANNKPGWCQRSESRRR